MNKLSIFEEFLKSSKRATKKAFTKNAATKEAAEKVGREVSDTLRNFEKKTVKVANDEGKISNVTGIINKKGAPKDLIRRTSEEGVPINYKRVADKENVFEIKDLEDFKQAKAEKKIYNKEKLKREYAEKQAKKFQDIDPSKTTVYKMPDKDAPKLGGFTGEKKTFKMKNADKLNDLRNTAKTSSKENNFLKNAVPTAVGGAMIFTMMNRRGQQSNSQLYGQQTPYQ